MLNLGHITDSIFHRCNGSIADRGDYYRIQTPANPTFFWGNYLLFKEPPDRGSYPVWMGIHAREFGDEQGHVAFAWDCPRQGDIEAFTENGFQADNGSVLTLPDSVSLKVVNEEIQIRKMATDSEWDAATELQIKTGEPANSADGYRIFKRRQMAGCRRMQEQGHGNWWGAFLDSDLVGDLGLFFDREQRLGRFQSVETAPAQQGKGICRSLLSAAATDARMSHSLSELVIVAEMRGQAEEIYRRAGFRFREHSYGICRAGYGG